MSEQLSSIELSPQQFKSRFIIISQLYDPFGRHYLIARDTVTGKRSIYKHYLAQTEDQQEAIYDNISNYIKLSQQQGICKILAYTRLLQEQQIWATFQYDQYSLGEYIERSEFVSQKLRFYVELLKQLTQIIRSMSEIGIDVDQLNYGNILVYNQHDELKIKVFYDQREKTFDKVLEGVKTFTSLQKLSAMLTGDQSYFAQLSQLQDGISPENIYQLGLLLIDLMYKCETLASQQDDCLVRDRPVSRAPLLNQEKSYYQFEDGSVVMNRDYFDEKIAYLKNNSVHLVKEITALAQSMIAPFVERVTILELPGEIDRLQKIFRDGSRKNVRSVSGGSDKEAQKIQKKSTVNESMSSEYQNADKNSNFNNEENNSNIQQNDNKPRSVNASNSSKGSGRRPFEQANNETYDITTQLQKNRLISDSPKQYSPQPNEFTKEQTHQQLSSQNLMIKKKKQVHSIDTFALGTNQGTNLPSYHQTLNNYPSSSYNYQHQYSSYSQTMNNFSNNIHKEFKYQQNSTNNTLSNSKQNFGEKTYTTNIINEHFASNSNATITYPDSEAGSKRNSVIMSQNKLDVSNQRPPKLIIPKETILMNLKTHQSIRASLETLIHQIENLPELRKKEYYDNSVYYGGVSQQTNKRTGLGVYVYPSGDIYFGTWLQNQLVDGTYIFKNGESYEGSVKNGKQGWGRYRYSNGNVYEGEWKDDIKEGKGTMWYPNMDKYEGQWVKGKKNGWGKYFYNNGTIYEGNFSNGRKQGFGTIAFPNGTKIEANWQQTHVQGQGKVFYPNGDFFHGQYQMSQKHGKGLYIWGSDNTKYQGEFKKDSLQGQARIYFTTSQYYYGRIKNGKRDGQGNYVYENGDSFSGEWKNDTKLIGHYKFKNGDQFEGKFKDNQLSFGLLKYVNGEAYQGEFRNGCRHGVGSYKDVNGEVVCEGHWENDSFISEGQ